MKQAKHILGGSRVNANEAIITVKCISCTVQTNIYVPYNQFEWWAHGKVRAEQAFPKISDNYKRFIDTGLCATCTEDKELKELTTDHMTLVEILAVARFLGNSMTCEQASQLMDEVRHLSIADKETLLMTLPGGPLYAEITMHDGEMGGLSHY